jgi:cell division protein FtsB
LSPADATPPNAPPSVARSVNAPPSIARPMIAMALAFTLLLLAAAGLKSWRDLQTSRAREATILERIRVTEASVERLQHRIDRLGHDGVTLERAAREELGMVKPGDVVIVLPPPVVPPPAAPPSVH